MRDVRSDELLRKLGSGIRPAPVSVIRDGGSSPDFDALLRSARRGELSSGRRVRVHVRLVRELTAEQTEDLDRAADAAEVAGVRRLLAITDDDALRIDVPTRETIDARALRSSHRPPLALIDGIDAAVVLRASEDGEEGDDEPAVPLAPGLRENMPGRIRSASLMRCLSGDDPRGD